jgi:hypothetical protein
MSDILLEASLKDEAALTRYHAFNDRLRLRMMKTPTSPEQSSPETSLHAPAVGRIERRIAKIITRIFWRSRAEHIIYTLDGQRLSLPQATFDLWSQQVPTPAKGEIQRKLYGKHFQS